MPQLASSKTVPADLHACTTHSLAKGNSTPGRTPNSAHLFFSRPVSPTLLSRLKLSASASGNLTAQAEALRRERMDELAAMAARRKLRIPIQRRASLPQPSSASTLTLSPLALPLDPSEWTPPQLARHLASILGLVSPALICDVRDWVCREGLDGTRFMALSDHDLLRMGLSTGWARTMIQGRNSLRWRSGWEPRSRKLHLSVSRRDVKAIRAFSFKLAPDTSLPPSPTLLSIESPQDASAAGEIMHRKTYHSPPDPTKWADLGRFLLWATLGLTIITGKVIATKFIMFVRTRS